MQNIQPFHSGVVSVQTQVQSGLAYWNGQVDTTCALSNPGNEWMCYISPIAVPHIENAILVQAGTLSIKGKRFTFFRTV